MATSSANVASSSYISPASEPQTPPPPYVPEPRQSREATPSGAPSTASPLISSSSAPPPPVPPVRKRSTLLNLHRVVAEQYEEEPCSMIGVKWLLIVCGFSMLAAVAYFMGLSVWNVVAREVREAFEMEEK